jgi:hypothetical protein
MSRRAPWECSAPTTTRVVRTVLAQALVPTPTVGVTHGFALFDALFETPVSHNPAERPGRLTSLNEFADFGNEPISRSLRVGLLLSRWFLIFGWFGLV